MPSVENLEKASNNDGIAILSVLNSIQDSGSNETSTKWNVRIFKPVKIIDEQTISEFTVFVWTINSIGGETLFNQNFVYSSFLQFQ